MSKFPFIQQHDEKDCGAACLSMISEYYGLMLPIAKFRDLIKVDAQGANIYGMVAGADRIGLDAEALEGTPEELMEGISNCGITFPFVARIVNEHMFEHFIVVYSIEKEKAIIGDPGKNRVIKVPISQFLEQWQGQIVTFMPNQNFEKRNERKGSFRNFFCWLLNKRKYRINTIKNCDYIYVMDKGKIIEQGTHQSLLEENGMYRKLVMCNG